MNSEKRRSPSAYGRVAVLMGGSSAEREISLISGNAVLAALKRRGIDAHGIDPRDSGIELLRDFDRVFVALHGRGGEDGTIQGALEALGLPYTGSGVLGSALAMDKLRTKQIWRSVGLPTPPFVLISNESEPKGIAAQVGLPFAVKPVHEGSSIGITKVTRVEELRAAWAAARELDDLVIAERWVDGEEYTGGVLGERVLPLIRLETPREFYDYEAKYRADTTRYHCPCGLPAAREEELRALCWQAFAAVGASGWGRVDFMLDSEGQPWLLEVNTVPGMTDHSLVPMAAREAGIDFDELVLCILDTSFARSAGVAREVA